jgi:hypothetical protein
MQAKLYRNTATYETPTWALVPNVKDLTLNLEKGQADVTTRANSGWKASIGTLKDGGIEFEMVWDTADEGFTAIRDAYLNDTALELAVMDGDITVAGSQGLRAAFVVTNFSRKEPLEEGISVSVTLKVAYSENAPEWMTVAGA